MNSILTYNLTVLNQIKFDTIFSTLSILSYILTFIFYLFYWGKCKIVFITLYALPSVIKNPVKCPNGGYRNQEKH